MLSDTLLFVGGSSEINDKIADETPQLPVVNGPWEAQIPIVGFVNHGSCEEAMKRDSAAHPDQLLVGWSNTEVTLEDIADLPLSVSNLPRECATAILYLEKCYDEAKNHPSKDTHNKAQEARAAATEALKNAVGVFSKDSIGTRIISFFPQEQGDALRSELIDSATGIGFYAAEIVGYNTTTRKHSLLYDDEPKCREVDLLRSHTWRVLHTDLGDKDADGPYDEDSDDSDGSDVTDDPNPAIV